MQKLMNVNVLFFKLIDFFLRDKIYKSHPDILELQIQEEDVGGALNKNMYTPCYDFTSSLNCFVAHNKASLHWCYVFWQ